MLATVTTYPSIRASIATVKINLMYVLRVDVLKSIIPFQETHFNSKINVLLRASLPAVYPIMSRYLWGRTFQIVMDCAASSEVDISIGVSQESVLGRFCFICIVHLFLCLVK